MTVLGALREVVEQEGVFCALYSDRARSLLLDAAGRREIGCGNVPRRWGRRYPGNEHSDDSGVFAASTRAFGTRVQNPARRLPQEAASAGHPHAGAGEQISGALRGRVQSGGFQVAALQRGRVSALHPKGSGRGVLGAAARVVTRDNTVVVAGTVSDGATLAENAGRVCGHGGMRNIWISCGVFGTGRIWWADTMHRDGRGCVSKLRIRGRGCGKAAPLETPKRGFPLRLEIPQRARDSRFPQPRRRRSIDLKPDISCAKKTRTF